MLTALCPWAWAFLAHLSFVCSSPTAHLSPWPAACLPWRCFIAASLSSASLARYLSVGVLGAILLVIVAGLSHFNAARAFSFPPGAFNFSSGFIMGLGAAMLLATYDYWGYYNVCFLGAEIKKPERNIPRAMLLSIVIVGCFIW